MSPNTLADAQTSHTHLELQSSFSVITAWSCVDRGTPREKMRVGRDGGEEVRAGGGYCRAHKAAGIFFHSFFVLLLETHFLSTDGVYSKDRGSVWGRQQKNKTRSIKAIRASESKHQETEEEEREAGRNPLIESLYHSGLVCLWVRVCVCVCV